MSPLWTSCSGGGCGVKAAAVARCLRPRGGPLRSGHVLGGHVLGGHALGGHPLRSGHVLGGHAWGGHPLRSGHVLGGHALGGHPLRSGHVLGGHAWGGHPLRSGHALGGHALGGHALGGHVLGGHPLRSGHVLGGHAWGGHPLRSGHAWGGHAWGGHPLRSGHVLGGHALGGHPLRSGHVLGGHALGGHPLPSDIAGGSPRVPAGGRGVRSAAGPWWRRGSPADARAWTASIAPRMAGLAGTPMGAQSRLWARGFTTQRGEVAEKPAVGTAAQQAQAAGSTNKPDLPIAESVGTPSKAQQLKRVFKEYGAVGVVFHISISLVSLGICYLAVSSGLDVEALLRKLGVGEAFLSSRAATGTSTFVLAYAMHKVMAPARISITLVSVPLLVRYLRRVGLFRPPVPKP